LWLDKNENLDPTLLELSHSVLREIPPWALSTYPEAGELYRKLARWAGTDVDQLLLTPGSDGAIRLVFEAFVEPGDAVIHTSPTFAMYPVYCQMFGAKAFPIEYEPTENGPVIDPRMIIATLRERKPKLLCIPNPDSPTGTVLAPNVLREILKECEENGTVLLIDEAYHPFYDWSSIPWTQSSRNLIVARTFAKAWGAAGMRIGYAAAHRLTIDFLHKMRPMYEVSTIAVEFMSRMLDKAPEMLSTVNRINEGKAFFLEEMRALDFKVLRTEGNFAHVAFAEKGPTVHAALKDKVLYRASFDQPCLVGYSRFSVGPQSTMSEVADMIKRAIGKNL
jgi:histidinol-phosphate aminotransferase